MSAVLEFDVEDHAYSMGGEKLPGVTSILATQFPINVPLDRLEFARNLGKAIHTATEFYDRGTLNIETLDTRVVPYLEAWQLFRKQTDCKILEIERMVFHKALKFAGTLDRVIAMGGHVGILDLKRPKLGPRVGVQLAAYEHAYLDGAAHLYRGPLKRWGLQLCPDQTPPYRLKEYKEREDWSIFVSCLSILRWRQRHGE